MKKVLFYLTFLLFPFLLTAQYSSNPAVGTQTGCPTANTTCGGLSYLGGSTTRWKVQDFPNVNEVRFQVRKCTNAFTSSGIVYIKEGTICGNIVGQENYSSGTSFQYVTVPLTHTGTKTYYAVLAPTGQSDRFYSEPITVTGSPQLPLSVNGTTVNPNSGLQSVTNFSFSAGFSGGSGQAVSMEVQVTRPDGSINYNAMTWNSSTSKFELSRTFGDVGTHTYRYAAFQSGSTTAYTVNGTFTVTGNPSISVSEPTTNYGFPKYQSNGTSGYLPIRWTTQNWTGNINIELRRASDNGYVMDLPSQINDGVYDWQISTSLATGEYKLLLYPTGTTGFGSYSSNFKIFDYPSLTTPSNNATTATASGIAFSWNKNNPTGLATYEFRIRNTTTNTLILDYTNVGDVSTYTPNITYTAGHSYTWVVRAKSGSNNVTTEGVPSSFTVPTAPIAVVPYTVSPTTGYQNYTDFYFSAGFSGGNGGATGIDIQYKNPDGTTYTATNTTGEVVFNSANSKWELTKKMSQNGDYQYRYIIYQGSSSNASLWYNLSILPPVTISTIPSTMIWNCIQNISWTSVAGTGNVSIELTDALGISVATIADGIANNGSFAWMVGKNNLNTNIQNFTGGTYKIKMYPTNTSNQGSLSNTTFTITTPTITVSQPTAINYIKGQPMNITWATSSNYCGLLFIEYVPVGGTSVVIVGNTTNDGSETWTIPNTLADGSYYIKVYSPVSSGASPVANVSATFTIGSDPNCPNCITGQTVTNFVQTGNEGFCAAQYLCSQKIIQVAQPNPTNAILREDVAKITTIALLDNPSTVDLYANPNAVSFPADNFPVPYNDLSSSASTCCGSYHRYAKILSYLDYTDGMPPFVRRASFNPTSTIQRVDLLQVYLEAWNIDESTASGVTLYFNDLAAANLSTQQLLYLKKAVQLGLVVNGTLATPIAFRPTDAATREEAFLILKRLRTSTVVTKPSQATVTSASSYFTPANLTPQNMSIARGMAQGNFSHYSEDGFSITDIGISLGFGFNYQSFLTEVPDEWKIVEPMGRGWTHGFNAHIFTTITSNDANAKPLLVVAWGDGTFDTYDNTNISVGFTSTDLPSHVSKIGIGNYDILSRPNSTTYTIKKKDQSIITFTSQGEAGLYRLSSITDKNSNTLSVVYKTGASIPFRVANKVIDYVQAPSGRRATFTYNTDNFITNISFPGSTAASPRNLTFTYNGFELKTFKDARGQVINKSTTYNYGIGLEAYLLKEIILPKGNKVVNEYNLNRKLTKSRVYGSNGNITNNTSIDHYTNNIYKTTTTGMDNVAMDNFFNTNGLPTINTGIVTATNINVNRIYDSNHPTKIASFTSNGVTTTSTYFPNGNIDQINYPPSIGGYEKFTFDAYNNPLTHRDAKGIITTMTYPDNKNLGSVTKAVGDGTNITQTFTYWANGFPKTSTNNEGIVTNFAYNAYGNLNSVNIPILNLTMTANYDYASRKTSVTNFKNQTSTFTYDENDNTKTETDAQNHTTSMAYDDNDNPITITNAKGKITTLTYDAFDRNISQTFEGSTKTYIFDDATNRLTEFRKAGYAIDNTRRFVYNYDINTGLLKSNGYIQNIDYDSKNRMSGIRGGNNASHQLDLFTYDDLNHLQSYRDFYGFTVGYGYDLNANVIRIDYPNGNKLYKTYDNLNRLKTLTWNTTLLITYNYVGSRLDNMVYGNTVKTALGYDNAGRPNSLITKTNNGTGSTIFSSNYTLDNLGNHLGENEIHPFPTVPLPSTSTTTYTVNSLNRLTSASTTTGSTSFTQTYGYDNDGNVNNKGFGNNLSHDIEDNLTNYTGYGLTLSAIYDALGNRRSVTRNGTETHYVLDINGLANILAETNASNVVQNYYIHGLGLVARIKADGTIHYYHADFRGSTVAMTNTSQAITHKYQYDEFGNQTNIQEADPNPFRYVGAYGIMHETPDLSYMRARYYDPTTGRFNSEDPIWSTNLYPYADSNPINYFDLDGHAKKKISSLRDIVLYKTIQIIGKNKLDTDFEKELFKRYWDGDGTTYTLTEEEFKKVATIAEKNAVGGDKATILYIDDVMYYKEVVSLYSDSELDYSLGAATILFDSNLKAVGIYDYYDFDCRLFTKQQRKSLYAELATCGTLVSSSYAQKGKKFKIKYGIID